MATKKVHRIELKKYLKNIYQVVDEQKTLQIPVDLSTDSA